MNRYLFIMGKEAERIDLADRIQDLIKRDFAGNLNRAANAWGVPQPTLHRYVNRRTDEPRARQLQRIAKFYGTTIDWLLDGVGTGPLESPYPIVELRAWETLVKALKLPAAVEPVVLAMPGSISSAHTTLCEWGMFNWQGKTASERKTEPAQRARWLASALELEAWTVWLRGLITSYGKAAVRNKLCSEVDRVRLGFQAFATYLRDTDRLIGDLAAAYGEIHVSGKPRAITDLNEPQMPPLNAARGRQPWDGRKGA